MNLGTGRRTYTREDDEASLWALAAHAEGWTLGECARALRVSRNTIIAMRRRVMRDDAAHSGEPVEWAYRRGIVE